LRVRLLALDTATEACSVALAVDGQIYQRQTAEPRAHAARVLSMIDACLTAADLRPADLQALAFGRGPGSFTGVRIATGVIQGLALGLSCPVLPVSTLAGFAATAWRLHGLSRVAVCLDARMGECYWGLFEVAQGVVTAVGAERLAAPAELPLPDGGGWLAVGSGWQACPDLLARMAPHIDGVEAGVLPVAADLVPTAEAAFVAGATVDAGNALPAYLRERVAWRT
jgi:tRNA threonylcarbamoyladenosine biosynthesis protein TsaB